MGIKTMIAGLALVLGIGACTPGQLAAANTVIDVVGNTCQVVLIATDPALVPLCTTATAIADAIAALVKAHSHAALDPASPGGVYTPSNDEVYAYLASHGARAAKKH